MSGNKIGAAKSTARILAKNPNHFKEIGAKGGKVKGVEKGFAHMKELDPELHKDVSAKGGRKSRKPKVETAKLYSSTTTEKYYTKYPSDLNTWLNRLFKKGK